MTHELELVRQIESFQALLSEIQREAIAHLPTPPSRLSASIMETSVALEELQVVVEAMRQQNEALLDAHHHLANEHQRYQNLWRRSAIDSAGFFTCTGSCATLAIASG